MFLLLQKDTQTYNDMLRISLVSGLHTPRSSCSKLEMRATPDPAKIKIDVEKMRTKKPVTVSCNCVSLHSAFCPHFQHGRLQGLTIVAETKPAQPFICISKEISPLLDGFTVKAFGKHLVKACKREI